MTTIVGLERARKLAPILGDPSSGVASVLLYGPRGCGKTLLVNQMAEAWLSSGEGDRAADSFRRGTNPDFFHIAPTGAGYQIQLRQISTPSAKRPDDPTPLIEFVRVAPLYSRHKVVWIEDVHRLNHDSANSLLKTLEEPPAYVKLILTTSQVSQIPATILSRCLVVNCELPTKEELTQSHPGLPDEIVLLADGAPGTLERISANQDLYRDIIRFADRIVAESRHGALSLGDEFRKLAERLEESEKLGIRNSNARIMELAALAISKRHPNRSQAVALLTEAHKRILGNANPALVLDAVLGRILLSPTPGTK
ncbi:MAG: AAA family ATPase [Armatimonadetes bacterium]|nr:AAA family ATPase [Armatimonadota bacterium]